MNTLTICRAPARNLRLGPARRSATPTTGSARYSRVQGAAQLTRPGLALCVFLALPLAVAADPPTTPTTVGTAAESITLSALVDEVLAKNPELAFYRAEIASAKAGRKTAAQWANPELEGDLGSKRVWERHGSTLGDGVAWSVSVAQTFEFPGRISLRKAIANRQIELAQLGFEQFQAALAARARWLGHAVSVAEEKVTAAREVTERFEALLEVLVQRDPAGVTPTLDLRILEATALTLRRRTSLAAQELQAALLELNQLRGTPPATPLAVVARPLPLANPPPLDVLLETARTRNFDLRMREVELAQQGFQVELSRKERYPAVTIAPYYAAERANDEQRIAGVGVRLPLPLWNRNQGAVETAEARRQQAETSLHLTWRAVERQVTEHTLALRIRIEETTHWRGDAARQFREAAELADRHYRLGAVPVTTYVEMQQRYLDALEALLATRSEILDHRQQLELAIGQPLEAAAQR